MCETRDYCAIQVALDIQSNTSTCGAGTCQNMLVNAVQTAGGPCVFPFVFNGMRFDNCITDDAGQDVPWCALTANYDTG